MRMRGAVMAAVVAASLVGVPAHAQVATLPVNQGDLLITPTGECTVGFVDKETRTSFTAAHCGADGARVGFKNSFGFTYPNVGTLRHAPGYTPTSGANDYAIIEWDPGVGMGGNYFTSGQRITIDDVQAGDQVCFHGYASHATSTVVTCGAYRDKLGHTLFYFTEYGTQEGDSGGPVWVPGKGFLGVITQKMTLVQDREELFGVEEAVYPEEGPRYNIAAVDTVGAQALMARQSSENPFDPSVEQASSNRWGEASSQRMDEGSSFDFTADETESTQHLINWLLAIVAGLGVAGIVGLADLALKELRLR